VLVGLLRGTKHASPSIRAHRSARALSELISRARRGVTAAGSTDHMGLMTEELRWIDLS